ncbi:MAG: ABC transporter ATP-binding protein [Gemmataceae bacterium]
MEPRSAYARAESFLNFTASHKWIAHFAAIGTALCTLGLFVFLGLFIDLLIHRGRVPTYSELNDNVRIQSDEELGRLGAEGNERILAGFLPEERRSEIPANAREWLWRAQVYDLFKHRVSDSAAEHYRHAVLVENQPSPAMGLLGLLVRQPGLTQRVFGWLASWNPWTWRPSGSGENVPYLLLLTFLAILVAILRAGLYHWMNHAAAVTTLDAATRLRRAVYHHTNRLGTLALHEGNGGEPVELFVRHIQNIHDALYAEVTTRFFEPILLSLLVIFALALDFWVGLACILLAAVVILVGGYLAAKFRDRARVQARRAAAQLALLQESVSMMRLVKSNLMDAFNQSRVERQLADYAEASSQRSQSESLFRPFLLFLATVAAVLALALAGFTVLQGTAGAGRLTLLVATLATAYWPLARILEERRVIRRGRDSAVRVFEFLDRPAEIGQVMGAEFLAGISRDIQFRSVSLREPGTGRLLLNDLDLTIEAGQRVAIVGSDDTEKHALVYLLVRFLDATTGEVRIDGKSLRALTLESLRAQIGMVLWSNLIFNDSVANNIGCGDTSVTMPQIIECAKLAHAHQFIQRLSNGYETPIGDLGVSLRASERFRIALARAILKDPSLYVIEEPRTPFDEERKGLVDDTLARILPGKTVIFLAHRISTIRSCDVVYLLHRGQIEAAGEHRELLATSDLYKHLHYLEFNEFAGQA